MSRLPLARSDRVRRRMNLLAAIREHREDGVSKKAALAYYIETFELSIDAARNAIQEAVLIGHLEERGGFLFVTEKGFDAVTDFMVLEDLRRIRLERAKAALPPQTVSVER